MEENQYEWINKEYIGKYLKVIPEDVLKYEIKSAVGKGNNYASKLLRVEVELLENKNVNFLIKCLPDGVMRTLIQDVGMWDKEQYMYNKVLPLIEKSIGCKLSPECLNKDSEDDNNINKEIILQDLNYLGYKMSDRTQQLDYDHCVIVMKTLAKFHAGSISVKKDHKKDIDHVGEELCFRETRRDRNEDYLKQPFECLSKELLLNNRNYNESELRRYRKGLKNIGDKFWDLIVNISKPKLNQFNVLNHGDLWTNNILFKYNKETGLVEDARLIDFQCCRYTTPAFDLQYFFMSSCNEQVRKTRLQELVDVYINYLNKELNNLNLKIILNDEELNRDLLMTDFYGLYTSIFVLPFSIRDSDNIEEVEDISEINDENSSGGNAFQNCIRGKKYQQLLPRLLSFYDKKGLFEDNYDVVDKFDVETTDNHVLN